MFNIKITILALIFATALLSCLGSAKPLSVKSMLWDVKTSELK